MSRIITKTATRRVATPLWLARDLDGRLFVYTAKPRRGLTSWICGEDGYYHPLAHFKGSEVVQWTDDEPTQLTFAK